MFRNMASARILGSIFERSHFIARNVLLRRNIPPYLKCSAWFHMKTSVNMNIEPNRWYENRMNQKNEETKENKEDKETKKDKRINWRKNLKIVFCMIAIGGLIILTVELVIYKIIQYNIKPLVYFNAVTLCRMDPKIVDVLGEPIEIVPQKNRIAHTHGCRKKDGLFYEMFTIDISGPNGRALLEVELKEVTDNEYEYTKLCVTVPKVGTFNVEPSFANWKKTIGSF